MRAGDGPTAPRGAGGASSLIDRAISDLYSTGGARRDPELAFRLLGLAAVATLTQVNFLLNPDPDVPVHAGVSAVEAAWLSSSAAFHRLSRPERGLAWARTAWMAVDVLLLTATLRILDASTSSLVVGYPLLIAASGLWSRVGLVWQTTAFALAGYAVLTLDAWSRGLAVGGNHHPDILMATMLVLGTIVAHQVRRIWALSAKDDRRPAARAAPPAPCPGRRLGL